MPAPSMSPAGTQPGPHEPHHEHAQQIWHYVSHTHMHNLWDFEGASPVAIVKRTFNAFLEDNLLSRAAELGYYFLFALFPTLVFASSIVGIVARHGSVVYLQLLHYLALVVPQSAYQMVLETFNQTTAASSSGKIGFGLAAALWSASVGFAAIQDTLNIVYKVKETRPYWKARGGAILVTVLLALIITLTLMTLFCADFGVHFLKDHVGERYAQLSAVIALRFALGGLPPLGWAGATARCGLQVLRVAVGD